LDVFRSSAGLSSAKLSPHVKKALYGLAGMVVQRVVDRCGFAGLHELCVRARAEDHEHVPTEWILEAAGLDLDTQHWRNALLAGMGQEELLEFVRGHPDLATPALITFLGPRRAEELPGAVLRTLRASLRLPQSGAAVELLAQPEVLASLAQ